MRERFQDPLCEAMDPDGICEYCGVRGHVYYNHIHNVPLCEEHYWDNARGLLR